MGRPKGSKNKRIAANKDGRIASAEIDRNKEPVESFEERENDDTFLDGLDDLLDTPFYTLNKMIPEFRKAMPWEDPKNWYVKWFFPNAENGPVYVDYPRTKHDREICEKKAKIMKDLGLIYKLFRPEEERKLQSAMEAIEGDAEIPANEAF